MSAPLISVRDLHFAYGPTLPEVLRGIDLEVQQGEFVALLGQNGAGKTTLAKHLNGLNQATRGTVEIAGKPISGRSLAEIARSIGYCYQNPDHQIFSSSVEKEVGFGPSNLGFSHAQVTELVGNALELVGLTELRKAHPFSLGRGQRQLVAVASVLAMDPPLLIIDEPTTGMDRVGATRIMNLLSQWAEQGRSIVAITHDMDIVAEYVPRSVVMAHGEIVADGPTQDVFRDAAILARAHLAPPPVVQIVDRLAPFGVRRCGSIEQSVTEIVTLYNGGRVASRI